MLIFLDPQLSLYLLIKIESVPSLGEYVLILLDYLDLQERFHIVVV